jgi:membrane-bound lytic murein transglycosylase A
MKQPGAMLRLIPRLLFAPLLLTVIAACTTAEEEEPAVDLLVLSQASFDDLDGWADDAHLDALIAYRHSCERLLTLPDDRRMGGTVPGTVGDWRGACVAAKYVAIDDDAAARTYFETWFLPYEVSNNDEEDGLFTGFFEPELNGALKSHGPYAVPLYAKPDDLITVDLSEFREEFRGERVAGRLVGSRLKPYPTRAAIDAGALGPKGRVLVWVDDPIDAFFLHIQGSGRILLDDGTPRRIGYAATNGHTYFPIGRRLIEQGAFSREEVSMQRIRAWMEANPDRAPALMAENRSFVFFRWVDGIDAALGPIGAAGVPLTAGRSLAVDRRHLPLNVPLWFEGSAPARDASAPDQTLKRLMIAQDTGGGIRGPVRGDVFWGTGHDAGEIAGRMKHEGRYWLLLPTDLDVDSALN